MAPFPDEVDVFSEPHSRMKRLVEVYSEKMSSTDFLNDEALESFLHSLQQTFCEFKTHEQIENKLIMKKLKNKLKALSIHDAAVCNCHNDSRLVDMLDLVRDGYSCTSKPYTDRQNYALKLENALNEFTQDFIPHMQEEEEVFQPLLVKYFEYEELKLLKERVLEEHTRWQQGNLILEEITEKATRELHAHSDKKQDVAKEPLSPFLSLPPELVSEIFSFLSPIDLVRCSGVNRHWNQLAYDPALWKNIDPIQWAGGNWIWQSSNTECQPLPTPCPCASSSSTFTDEDADMDDLLICSSEEDGSDCRQNMACQRKVLMGVAQSLLPQVGSGVVTLKLSQSTALTSRMLLSMLKHCPNLRYLDVSYTHITDVAFKGLNEHNTCHRLEYMDLSGCDDITDLGLERFAAWFLSPAKHNQRTICSQWSQPWRVQPWECSAVYECPLTKRPCPYATVQTFVSGDCRKQVQSRLKFLSLSGCHHITDTSLRLLSELGVLSKVEHLDVSGCWQLSGPCLQDAASLAPRLDPEGLFYCSNILDGPYQDLANGCENLECTFRACCCNGD